MSLTLPFFSQREINEHCGVVMTVLSRREYQKIAFEAQNLDVTKEPRDNELESEDHTPRATIFPTSSFST
jgi:hypothetical protein